MNTKSNETKTQLSKGQLLEAVRKKKECNARAQVIVESLLERCVAEEDFLLKVRIEINKCHYDDVIDERNILHICSYPLCVKICENVPKKQYQISTVSNKVYDITDRKKFCSTRCFKASEYIKSQMLTSPLWLRQQEAIPEFKLLKIKEDTLPELDLLNIN